MNAITFLQHDPNTGAKPHIADLRAQEEAQVWGAIIGLVGGLTAAAVGSLLTAAGWMTADGGAKHWLATTGTVLLCLTIPLIVFGACCLDWLEKDKSQGSPKAGSVADDEDE